MRSRGYLLDTSVFIWLMEKSPRLSQKLFDLLGNPKIQVSVSVASIWEIVIKRKKTPLRVPQDIIKGIKSVNFLILPIEAYHVMEIEKLPDYHKDPFDRMLVAQARTENLTLITSDKKIWRKYKVSLLKA